MFAAQMASGFATVCFAYLFYDKKRVYWKIVGNPYICGHNCSLHVNTFKTRNLIIAMDLKLVNRLEYEEQFFKFSSEHFFESFKGILKEQLASNAVHLVVNIKRKLLPHAANKEEFILFMKEMESVLVNEYLKSCEKTMEIMHSKISKNLSIPDHVLLEEDILVRTGLTTDVASVRIDINKLQGSLLSKKYMEKKVLEEIEMADKVIQILETVKMVPVPSLEQLNDKVHHILKLSNNLPMMTLL